MAASSGVSTASDEIIAARGGLGTGGGGENLNPGAACAGLPRVQFRYFRFRCKDIDRTIQFYQALGMVVLLQYESPSAHHLQVGYKVADNESIEANVDLLFDCEKDEEARSFEAGQAPKGMQDYLVIYVHIIRRLVSRLEKLGFEPVCNIQNYNDIQFAGFRDPNGLDVRLMELTDTQLSEDGFKQQWFARIAYYAFNPPCPIESAIRYFEAVLSWQPKANDKAEKKGKKNGANQQQPPNFFAAPPPSFGSDAAAGGAAAFFSAPGKHSSGAEPVGEKEPKRQGFLVVDDEEAVTGLTRTLYYWLGSSPRELGACLCLTQRAPEKHAASRPIAPDVTRLLIGLGFQVPSVEEATRQLERELGCEMAGAEKLQPVDAAGRITTRFVDPLTRLQLDLYSAFDPDKDKQRRPATPPQRRVINYDHLGGLRPVLSQGAIVTVRAEKGAAGAGAGPAQEAQKKLNAAAARRMDKFELVAPSEGIEEHRRRMRLENAALKAAGMPRKRSL